MSSTIDERRTVLLCYCGVELNEAERRPPYVFRRCAGLNDDNRTDDEARD